MDSKCLSEALFLLIQCATLTISDVFLFYVAKWPYIQVYGHLIIQSTAWLNDHISRYIVMRSDQRVFFFKSKITWLSEQYSCLEGNLSKAIFSFFYFCGWRAPLVERVPAGAFISRMDMSQMLLLLNSFHLCFTFYPPKDLSEQIQKGISLRRGSTVIGKICSLITSISTQSAHWLKHISDGSIVILFVLSWK